MKIPAAATGRARPGPTAARPLSASAHWQSCASVLGRWPGALASRRATSRRRGFVLCGAISQGEMPLRSDRIRPKSSSPSSFGDCYRCWANSVLRPPANEKAHLVGWASSNHRINQALQASRWAEKSHPSTVPWQCRAALPLLAPRRQAHTAHPPGRHAFD